jgi:chromosome segregation ATPase
MADQLQALRVQLDDVLKASSEEYAELLAKEDKTFEDLQALATLRHDLVQNSEEAQGILDQMQTVREDFRATRPHGPRRPELSEEDQAAVAAHKETMQGLAAELEGILKAASEEYAALAAKEDKSVDDIRQMQALRQQLLLDSGDAQAKLAEMQQTAQQFREEYPELPMGGPRMAQGIRRRAEAVHALKETIDEILAQDSPRYGELVAKQNKTQEEIGEMVRLRQKLMAENEDARQLHNATQVMNGRVRGTIRRLRNRQAQTEDPAAGE